MLNRLIGSMMDFILLIDPLGPLPTGIIARENCAQLWEKSTHFFFYQPRDLLRAQPLESSLYYASCLATFSLEILTEDFISARTKSFFIKVSEKFSMHLLNLKQQAQATFPGVNLGEYR